MRIDFMNWGKLEIWRLQKRVITVTKLGALKEENYVWFHGGRTGFHERDQNKHFFCA